MALNTYYILAYVVLLLSGRFISQSQRKSERSWGQIKKIAEDLTAIMMMLSGLIGFGMPLLEAALCERVIHAWSTATGVVLIITGFFMVTCANRAIAENWSSTVAKTDTQRLTKSGVYSIVRHPLYIAGLLLLIGTNVYFENSWSWLSTILVFIIICYRIPIEEKQLERRFGKEYADYNSRTKALFPWIL